MTSQTKLVNLIRILNNIFLADEGWFSVAEITDQVNRVYPYNNIKPDMKYPTYSCSKQSIKNQNNTYLNFLTTLGYLEKRFSSDKEINQFKVLMPIPHRGANETTNQTGTDQHHR